MVILLPNVMITILTKIMVSNHWLPSNADHDRPHPPGIVDGGRNLWFCLGLWAKHRADTHLDHWHEVVPEK